MFWVTDTVPVVEQPFVGLVIVNVYIPPDDTTVVEFVGVDPPGFHE
jgi:hypothetical protein